MRYTLDRSVRRSGPDGHALLGGSPVRLFRLTAAGAALFDRISSASAPANMTTAEQALIDRWVAAGLLHPDPVVGSGPYGPQDVTIVVPVRDRPDGLRRLLDSLLAADALPGAIVVVDDGSADPEAIAGACTEVSATAETAGTAVELVRCATSGGPAAARNEGAARVRTPMIVFVDSDCTVGADWLEPLLAAFATPSVGMVAPRTRAGSAAAGPPDSLLRYERLRSPLDMGPEPGRVAPGTRISYVPSAALAVRASAFDQLGGFDEALRVGEDVDLIWRAVDAGHGVRFEPRSGVRHEVRDGLVASMRQRFDYGTSAAALDERHPGQVAPVVISGWSAAVWALVAAGHPLGAAALAAGTTAQLRRGLADVSTADVLRLGLGGHRGAGRQLARAMVRVWWPIAVPAAMVSRRARRVVVVSVAWTVLDAWRDRRERLVTTDQEAGPPLDPVRFAALTLLDDVSYGAGVWAGCRRARSWGALLPRFASSQG